jgi:hypothetical protein
MRGQQRERDITEQHAVNHDSSIGEGPTRDEYSRPGIARLPLGVHAALHRGMLKMTMMAILVASAADPCGAGPTSDKEDSVFQSRESDDTYEGLTPEEIEEIKALETEVLQ